MKKYLSSIRTPYGAIMSIGYYADTPNKNYRIYYCGSDTGDRFDRLGNAARALGNMVKIWKNNGITEIIKSYATKNEIPRRGSNV